MSNHACVRLSVGSFGWIAPSLLFVLSVAATACGDTHYVAANGSDEARGTQSKPWLTLQHAADNVNPGDTVSVGPGNYAGFQITKGGTATARVTFHAEPGAVIDTPVNVGGRLLCGINCSSTDRGTSDRREYYTIEGFTIRPSADTPGWYAGIRTRGCPSDAGGDWAYGIIVRNNTCEMRSVDALGLFSAYTDGLLTENNEVYGPVKDTLIYVSNSARNYITRGNYLHDAPQGIGLHNNGDNAHPPGLNLHAVIENNVIANVNTGISCDGVQDSVIRNNVAYGIRGKGISLYAVNSADGCRRDVVVNNTIHVISTGQVPLRIGDRSGENVIFNNVFFKDTGGSTHWWGEFNRDSLDKTSCDFNLVTDQLGLDGDSTDTSKWRGDGSDKHSLVCSDLSGVVANAAAGDYHLKAGSPAIGAGTSQFADTKAPTTDITGTDRQNSRFCIGAYEYVEPAIESTATVQGH